MMNDDLMPVGATVGRYTVEGLLGQGGMAAVYKVRHEQLNTLHALKMLTVPGRRIRQRLVQEGRVQAALRHPNIVSVIDIIEHENQPGLVMEYVDGPTLEELLDVRELEWSEIDALGRGIIRGVQAAHAQGLIHRDLKPANVLIAVHDDALVPKVTDFGLAKLQRKQTSGHTRSGDTMGTPAYMAPEAIKNAKNVDHRADVFSLGALLYELVTGERCFRGDDILETFTAVVNADHIPVRTLKPDVPERMEHAIERALHPAPEDRLQDVRALLDGWIGVSDMDPGTTLTFSYTSDLLDRVRSMGQGRESLSQVLSERETLPLPATPAGVRRSLRSLDTRPDTTETFFPEPETPSAVQTLLEVNDPEVAAQQVAAQQVAPEPEPPATRRPWLVAGLAGVVAFSVVLGLGMVGAAGVLSATATTDVGGPLDAASTPAIPATPPPEPSPAPPGLDEPVVQAPAQVPAAPAPAPPTPQAAPTPAPEVPELDPQAAAGPAPSGASDAPAEGTATDGTPAVPADMARVEVTGGVRVLLRRDGGGAYEAGLVPPGTYTVAAYFDTDPVTVRSGVSLAAGQTLQLRCVKEMNSCR